MLKIVLLLLILILQIMKLDSTIHSNSYCLRSTKKCSGKYKTLCGGDFCAVDSRTCTQLVKYNMFLKVISLRKNLRQTLYENLLSAFAKCPVQNEFQFKLNEVCIPRMDCFKKRQSAKLVSKCACPDGQHSTPCSNRFCVKNEKTCREFESKSAANKSILLQIKYCA